MIDPRASPNSHPIMSDVAALAAERVDERTVGPARSRRLTAIANLHYAFIWRSLRRLGVAEQAADDAAQQVFVLCAVKLDVIAEGCERAFLFQTALRVAMSLRRDFAQRREAFLGEDMEQFVDPQPHPDVAVEVTQRRALLDRVLDMLPMDQRAVFVLYEIEGLAAKEIAALLSIPVGTVASRLKRGRETFQSGAARVRLQMERGAKR
jgi:RNA polymerase sigma-70 factor (ECF subfamily)